ncbi:MAG: hypothetical protein JNK18_06830 [Cyclobacteriaceae bacterium]|nr:hypothetical protein [Cyclobacteriaceae bacterium]
MTSTKISLGLLFALLVFFAAILDGCAPDESSTKFTGTITSQDDSGISYLKDIPVEIRLYEDEVFGIPVNQAFDTEVIVTDEDGHYKLEVPQGKYKSYAVRVVDEYYRKCTGSLVPLEFLFLHPVEMMSNKNDISACNTCVFKIIPQKVEGSTKTLEIVALGTGSFEVLLPNSGDRLDKETDFHFFEEAAEVVIKFIWRDSEGQVVTSSVNKYPVVPGTTKVIEISY